LAFPKFSQRGIPKDSTGTSFGEKPPYFIRVFRGDGKPKGPLGEKGPPHIFEKNFAQKDLKARGKRVGAKKGF